MKLSLHPSKDSCNHSKAPAEIERGRERERERESVSTAMRRTHFTTAGEALNFLLCLDASARL